jgi:hypothetical protein
MGMTLVLLCCQPSYLSGKLKSSEFTCCEVQVLAGFVGVLNVFVHVCLGAVASLASLELLLA